MNTDKLSYNKGSSVAITITAKDTASKAPINGASTTTAVYGPNGKSVFSTTSNTDQNDISTFTYKLSTTAQKGTYIIKTATTAQGYLPSSIQTVFNVK